MTFRQYFHVSGGAFPLYDIFGFQSMSNTVFSSVLLEDFLCIAISNVNDVYFLCQFNSACFIYATFFPEAACVEIIGGTGCCNFLTNTANF